MRALIPRVPVVTRREDRYAAARLFTAVVTSFSAGAMARTSEAMQTTKQTILNSNRFRFVGLIARNIA